MQLVVRSYCTYDCTLAVALSRLEAVQREWLACIMCKVSQVNKGRVLKSGARLLVSCYVCVSNNASSH